MAGYSHSPHSISPKLLRELESVSWQDLVSNRMTHKFFRPEVEEARAYGIVISEPGVKLDQNESPWDVPLELKVAITEKLIKTDFNRYPLEDVIDFKKQLARLNNIFPDQVVASNGSNVLIQALTLLIKPRGKVFIMEPTFPVYRMQAELFGHKVIAIPLSDDFHLQPDLMLAAIKKENPNLIFIANPNAPTGNLFAKEKLYKILKAAACLTVIDEAYYPYSGETLLDWLNEFPHLVILRTLSKAFGMAGVRAGYAMGDADVIFQLSKVLLPFCLSRVAIAIASEVINHTGVIEKNVKQILKERRRIFEEMQKIEGVSPFPSDSNYITFRSPNSVWLQRELKKRGVIIRDVADANRLKNCLRVTIGTSEENTLFLQAMKEVFVHH